MQITAKVTNSASTHSVEVATEGSVKSLAIAPKASGRGSSVNGGELLMAALATCVCNDIFREAAKRSVSVHDVEVEALGVFAAEGAPAEEIRYGVRISGKNASALRDLVRHTDTVAEIQNTVRTAIPVQLGDIIAVEL